MCCGKVTVIFPLFAASAQGLNKNPTRLNEMVMRNRGKTYSQQLDLLRGMAIVLMIVNHSGVRLLDPAEQQQGLLGALLFLGSFAPVVFFFTTGFGIGIGRREVTLTHFGSTLLKAGLLLFADQLMFWENAKPFGLDFLGFIALSSVVVTGVAACKRPRTLCVAFIVIAFVLRFGIGPWLRIHGELPARGAWLFGVTPVDGISYPLSPWIINPLLGFLMAHRYSTAVDSGGSFLWPWVSVPAIGALALSVIMYAEHAIFFRWGTVSFAFFVLSISLCLVCVVAAWRLGTKGSLATRLLSLRGIASLAVVPIHFALIETLVASGIAPLAEATMLAAMATLVAVSLFLSRLFARRVDRWIFSSPRTVAWYPVAAVAIFSAIAIWTLPRPSFAVFAAMVVGQLAIAGLIEVRGRRIAAAGTDLLQTRPSDQ